jgi:hypothetical protein
MIRAVGLGWRSIWGALSIVRLLESAHADDVLRWAAYSDRNTQRLVGLLHGTWPERAMVGAVRAAGESSGEGDAVAPEIVQLFRDLAPFISDEPTPARGSSSTE